ncbi:MAG TPA: metallophosphoesterase family protein [Fimbriiglobus sp.]
MLHVETHLLPRVTMDRRDFLGFSFETLAAALASGPSLLVPDRRPKPDKPGAFDPDTLFLTWQRDPCTTMTVQWIGTAADAAPVTVGHRYGGPTKTFTPTAKPYPLSAFTTYRTEITGLEPGTEYRFTLGTNSPDYHFRTMPAKLTNAFTFVSGGDCGTNLHAVANNVIAAKQDPMFALICGDLGYDNGRSTNTSLTFYRNYAKTMIDSKGRLVPMVVGIGNHEVNGSYNKTRDKAPFYFALHDGLYPDTSYAALDFGNYLSLVILDTGHVCPIGGEQTSWLDKALRDRTDRPHLLVANHVPAYPSYRNPDAGANTGGGTGAGNRKFWVPLFEKYNVDVVLEHHDHTFKRTHPMLAGHVDNDRGILYLGDGSWGKLRAPKSPEDRPYLAHTSQNYHMTVHRLEGDKRFHMALADTGQIIDITTTAKKPRRKHTSVG